LLIEFRISNAIVRGKKGGDRIAEYIPVKAAEKQMRRFLTIL
jgi:hypothetical protein